MWSQLKKNLGDNVIQKIGDVVAPPPEDSQSDSSYGSYEEEEEEEQEEEEDAVSDDNAQDNDIIGNKTRPQVANSVREVGKLFGGVLKRAINEVNNTSRNLVMGDQEVESHESYDFEDDQWSENDIELDSNVDDDSVPIESLTQHLSEWNDFIQSPSAETKRSEKKQISTKNDAHSTLGIEEKSTQSITEEIDEYEIKSSVVNGKHLSLQEPEEQTFHSESYKAVKEHVLSQEKEDSQIGKQVVQAQIAAEMEAQRLQQQQQLERKEEEEAKLAEQARIAAEMEAQRLQQQQQQKRKEEEEAKLAEQARIAAEMEAQRLQQQQKRKEEEEAKLAEQARIAAEMEAQRLQQQQQQERKEEAEAKLAEQARIASEDLVIDIDNIDCQNLHQELGERINDLESDVKSKDEQILLLQNELEKNSAIFKEESLKNLKEYESSLSRNLSLLNSKDEELKEMVQLHEEQRKKIEDDYSSKLNQVQEIAQRAASELSNKDASIARLQQQILDYEHEIEGIYLKKLSSLEQKLDTKDAEIGKLKTMIKKLEDDVRAKTAEHAEVDEEADELHQENEELQNENQNLRIANEKLKQRVKDLETSTDRSVAMHIEMQLMKEERDREANKLREIEETQSSSILTLTSERDTAISQIRDLEQRLTTLQADFDVTQADLSRVMQANSNLQTALEAFQSESEAELALLEESRASSEQALIASHNLALELMKKENQKLIDEIQMESDKAIRKMMNEVAMMEDKQAVLRKENVELRRSLDEAIKQLQMRKEDVIDRTLMKNILLDWFTKTGKSKRDVLMVMSSVLHFSDEDKSVCGLNESGRTLGKVVNSINPLQISNKPPTDVEGENVREKFVNFLLAECGDSPSK